MQCFSLTVLQLPGVVSLSQAGIPLPGQYPSLAAIGFMALCADGREATTNIEYGLYFRGQLSLNMKNSNVSNISSVSELYIVTVESRSVLVCFRVKPVILPFHRNYFCLTTCHMLWLVCNRLRFMMATNAGSATRSL